jgi:hypothetical protein
MMFLDFVYRQKSLISPQRARTEWHIKINQVNVKKNNKWKRSKGRALVGNAARHSQYNV